MAKRLPDRCDACGHWLAQCSCPDPNPLMRPKPLCKLESLRCELGFFEDAELIVHGRHLRNGRLVILLRDEYAANKFAEKLRALANFVEHYSGSLPESEPE